MFWRSHNNMKRNKSYDKFIIDHHETIKCETIFNSLLVAYKSSIVSLIF